MADMIFDNPKTMCREVLDNVNSVQAATIALSIPRAAIELKLTPFFMPWGTYAEPAKWGSRIITPGQFVPRSGVPVPAEIKAVLKELMQLWDATPFGPEHTMVKFWEVHGHRAPNFNSRMFASFCARERRQQRQYAAVKGARPDLHK